jgi:two-component system sensor histidine kinase KdpD
VKQPVSDTKRRPWKRTLVNFMITSGMLLVSFLLCEGLYRAGVGEQNIIIVMVLAVFIVAAVTDGYAYGILATVCIVFLYDFLITTPRLGFSFTLGFPVTLSIMLLVTLVTSTITTRLKQKMRIAESKEQRAELLYEINRKLLSSLDESAIARYALEFLKDDLHSSVALFTSFEDVQCPGCYYCGHEGDAPLEFFTSKAQYEAVRLAAVRKQPAYTYLDEQRGQRAGYYLPVIAQGTVYGVFGVSCLRSSALEARRAFLELIVEQTAQALLVQALVVRQREAMVTAEAEKIQNNFLRSISHDLRTPLTSIIGASATFLENRSELPVATQMQLLKDIQTDSQWLFNMVENILSITKIHQNNMVFDQTEEVVEEVVGEAVALFRAHYPDSNIHIQQPDELILAPMDNLLIIQVLSNLFENSYRHSHGSRITIQIKEAGGFVECIVQDDGIGIDAHLLPHIFQMQPIRRREDASRGLGIGLSLCKTILKAHRGWIKARNLPGGGACFTFGLPVQKEPAHDE